MTSIAPLPSFPAGHTLDKEEREAARAARLRFGLERLSIEELVAEHREEEETWLLLLGDLAAEDFSWYTREVLMSGIAYAEWRLIAITHQMQRLARSGIGRTEAQESIELQARFDRMRRVDIVEGLQTLGVVLEKRGREWKGLCPFHEDHHPSLSVNQDKGLWCCYSCGASGDLVSFFARRQHTSSVGALSLLETFMPI